MRFCASRTHARRQVCGLAPVGGYACIVRHGVAVPLFLCTICARSRCQYAPSWGCFSSRCSYDNTAKVCAEDDDDFNCITTLEGHTSTVWSASFDATGRLVVTGSQDGSLIVWCASDPSKSGEYCWRPMCNFNGLHASTVYRWVCIHRHVSLHFDRLIAINVLVPTPLVCGDAFRRCACVRACTHFVV